MVVRIRGAILGFNGPQLQRDSTSDNYSALLNVPGFEGDSNSKILFSLRNCSVDCRTLRKSVAPRIRTTTGGHSSVAHIIKLQGYGAKAAGGLISPLPRRCRAAHVRPTAHDSLDLFSLSHLTSQAASSL